MDNILKKTIKKFSYILVITLIIVVIALLILKYNVEGEKNMPFKLSSIIIVSSAEGNQTEENPNFRWDSEIYQINDIYLNIEKNKNFKEETIKSIKIDNLKVIEEPNVGTLFFYRPSNEESNMFSYESEYKIEDSIEYIGDIESNLKDLKISNQGCTLILRAINKTRINYQSNEEEFKHNGDLLNKINISNEDIKTKISFDLIINLESRNIF